MNATPARAALVVRVVGIVMIVLGLIIWTGKADGLIPVHMLVGLVLVVALWTVAYGAYRAGARPGLVALTAAWGLFLPALGVTQHGIMPGDTHWVVQVVHVLAGLVAIGLAEALGRAPAAGASVRSR